MEKSLTQTLENDNLKIEVLRLHNDQLSIRAISEITGIPRTTLQTFIAKKSYRKWWDQIESKPFADGKIQDHHKNIKSLKKNCYVLTSAQNNTFVHKQFFDSLRKLVEQRNAQLIIGTFAYNINAFQNLEKGAEWYDPLITEYIVDEPVMLADGLIWCGELNILPTATNPLSGLQSYARNCSAIFPHAKLQLDSVPTHLEYDTKMLYTTGAITKRNYIQKKAGQKASFHHAFAALIVEVDSDGDWFVRQLVADEETGTFQDLDTLYTPTGYVTNQKVEAINWGDIHVEKLDKEVADACFYSDSSMLNVLKPKYQFIHDLYDFSARNHHNINDPYHRFVVYNNKEDKVEDEIDKLVDFLNSIDKEHTKTVVVESNHDLALRRWLKEADYKTDPANAVFFLMCQLEIYSRLKFGEYDFNLLQWLCEMRVSNRMHFLSEDQSFKICNDNGHGIECSSHGHRGANGSRGSLNTFTKLEARYNVGHSHSAAIRDGVYVAGVCADKSKMEYVKGPSSWSNSNIITYPNGRRTIVTIKSGKWKAKIKKI